MVSNALSGQIEALVDSLRNQTDAHMSMTEVASVTEVLIKTMQLYFRSVDVQVYEECMNLTDYISNARREIAALQPDNLEKADIPRAGKELDAIVRHTEEATNTIMDASEKIMAADDESDPETYRGIVNEEIMRIFEACSFQDITGQRISKVVETLTYIENRASQLRSILGVEEPVEADEEAEAAHQETAEDGRNIMSGPALEGEGIDQSAVDALMDGGATPKPEKKSATTVKKPVKTAGKKPAPQAKENKPETQKATPPASGKPASEAPAEAKKAAARTKLEEVDVPKDEEGRTTQAEIDALFG